ncbi:hypothetical protein [Pseudonocardia sp. H11422]|uniref:hypothetical protein n=1 Tax=Pseudonocardia sp. H11422 TaxID=2835866 RepID=UPI001BDCD6E6|nr:hypothetical protein [Pseudonocardia sp. H11422]
MATEHGHGHDHDHGTDATLARIEALSKEGVHRAGEHEGPFSLHVLGLGGTGAAIITELLKDAPEGFTALAVDIGDADLAPVRAAAGALPAGAVQTVALPIPTREELLTSLNRWREFLKMEYPRYYWNPNYEPWLPGDLELPAEGARFPRAVAKAIYGAEYYQNREITAALDTFAAGILAGDRTPLVVVPFALGGGVGSGIVVEIARHLSTIKLGRRPWVVGIGVLPSSADAPEVADGSFFPAINELDCMIDTEKNNGVMAVWGDLYKNPFTGGFFAVPQDDVQAFTGDLAATHAYLDSGIAKFLSADGGKHLYETLKALNWLAVPGDQWHPAIRGQQSDRWVNVLTTRRLDDAGSLASLGLNKGLRTEYAEARVFAPAKDGKKAGEAVAKAIGDVATTAVEPVVLPIDSDAGFVSVLLPRASKLDLSLFVPSRDTYDTLEWDDKLLMHSWLLDLGVMLCEPSIRFDGMGGECIWGCACWVVVPHAAIRGEEITSPVSLPEAEEAATSVTSN